MYVCTYFKVIFVNFSNLITVREVVADNGRFPAGLKKPHRKAGLKNPNHPSPRRRRRGKYIDLCDHFN